ncbi:SDR family oxidoreductase [Hufsiella ginkgonis]|uniref:SDR family NAD(P)-dependent oxidoreductase n=1 Tax=Hufsiella ginkgonis TaxID=2695274 RepID=A0A7K1XU66_9SPHI|nr:SDR family oxidoreductase [Hufsiella ginkgonis]MXV14522.1 SDR family NAD(P)-dependent oxidoreductase [Hufsiella ginkgonis]
METSTKTKHPFAAESLEGKRILITGGTTGIGRAAALMLAAQGANVLICGRHAPELNDTLADAEKLGLSERITGVIADLGTETGIKKIFSSVEDRFTGLDVLVNNAALAFDGIEEGSYSDWQYVLNTNLLAPLACTNEAAKLMKANGGGHIVNIGSMSAVSRGKDSSVYVATKSGLQGFSASVRKELNPDGIKVSLIEPGLVDTDMIPGTPEEHEEKKKKGEMLVADDIARSIVYVLTQTKNTAVIDLRIRPLMQES